MSVKPNDERPIRPHSRKQFIHNELLKVRREGVLQIYLELGANRTLDRAREQAESKFGKIAMRTMYAWSSKFGWTKEAARWDAARDKDVISRIDSILDVEKMELNASIEFMMRKVLKILCDAHLPCRDPTDAQKLAIVLDKMIIAYERLNNPDGAHRKNNPLQVKHEHHHTHEIVEPIQSARDAAAVLEQAARAKKQVIDVEPVVMQLPALPEEPPRYQPIISADPKAEPVAKPDGERRPLAEALAERLAHGSSHGSN